MATAGPDTNQDDTSENSPGREEEKDSEADRAFEVRRIDFQIVNSVIVISVQHLPGRG